MARNEAWEELASQLELAAKHIRTIKKNASWPHFGEWGAQYEALKELAECGEMAMGLLAAKMETTKQNATSLIDRMEKNGFAQTRQDPDDKRSQKAKATEEGLALMRMADGKWKEDGQRVIGEMEKERLAQLLRLLRETNERLANEAASDAVKSYLSEIGKYPLLTAEKEMILAKQAAAGDAFAKKALTESSLRIVVAVAKKHMGKGVHFRELVDEGNLGLMRAMDKYDYAKGHSFSTYATWWIQKAIESAIAQKR